MTTGEWIKEEEKRQQEKLAAFVRALSSGKVGDIVKYKLPERWR